MKFSCSMWLSAVTAVALSTSVNSLNGQTPLSSKTTTSATTDGAASLTRRDVFEKAALAGAAIASSSLLVPSQMANAESLVSSSVATEVAPVGINLPRMGLGCWAWGDPIVWGYDPKNDGDLKEVFDYAVHNSRNNEPVLFDTAELYGLGISEKLLGEYANEYYASGDAQVEVQIASKFAALPFRTKPENVVKACQASMKRLGGRPIELYQIHFPSAWANAAYWDGLALAYEKGYVKAVGVSNYGVDAVRACHAALAKRGIPLATNQIQFSLLYPFPEQNGLLQACDDLGVKVLSYSPLALGLLTGKYNTQNQPKSVARQKLFEKTLSNPKYDDLLATMRQVSDNRPGGGTVAQVAINYARAKNTIPIPGARTQRQVQQNYDALQWNLSKDEVEMLEKAASGLAYSSPDAAPFTKTDFNTGLTLFDS